MKIAVDEGATPCAHINELAQSWILKFPYGDEGKSSLIRLL